MTTLPLFAPGAVEQDDDRTRDAWATPPILAANLVREFRCTLDVAASPSTAKCSRFYTASDDGLSQPWDGVVWCNPPYSDPSPWVKRAIDEGHRGAVSVLLLPAMVGVSWFTLMSIAADWWTFDRRIAFVPPAGVVASSSPLGNVLAVFGVNGGRWRGIRAAYDGSIVFTTEGVTS
jgi:DNA (cytosine-5)-methyltransferase 1